MIQPFCIPSSSLAIFIAVKFCYQKNFTVSKGKRIGNTGFYGSYLQQTKLSCCSKMTKLMQWLFFGILFLSFWISLLTKKINLVILDQYPTLVLLLPAILIVLFGVYAGFVVLWRVYTFNDCEDAALELKRQIKEAKADLKVKGFIFKEEKT